MIRITTALLLASSVALFAVSQASAKKGPTCPPRACGEEIPQVRGLFDGASWFASPPPAIRKASSRRRAHFYSWEGGCYALDRSRQWHQVDHALC